MVTFRNTVMPLLLLVCTAFGSAQPLADSDGTLDTRAFGDQEQIDKVDGMEVPQCYQTCKDKINNSADSYIPLCAMIAPDTRDEKLENANENSYSCRCTDKVYLEIELSCMVKECAKNSTAIDLSLARIYSMCKLNADIEFPKPADFLKNLCLFDDVPTAIMPTDLAAVRDLWPDYSFAKTFPSQTATTIRGPHGLEWSDDKPKWTCTPTSLPDGESQEDTTTTATTTGKSKPSSSSGSSTPTATSTSKPSSSSGSSTPTATGQSTTSSSGSGTLTTGNPTETSDQSAATSGKQGMLRMAMVVLTVAAVVLIL